MAYNPSQHLPISKPLGTTGKFPLDAKREFYTAGGSGVYAYRAFVSPEEVNAYFPAEFRRIGDTFLVNADGELQPGGGGIVGGTNAEYWYKDGIADEDLVPKEGGNVTKVILTKSGSDVSDYSLSVADQDVPDNPMWVMYINGVSPAGAVLYDKETKLFTNLPGVSSGDVIEIYFI